MSYLTCTQYTDINGCISPVSKDLLGCTLNDYITLQDVRPKCNQIMHTY